MSASPLWPIAASGAATLYEFLSDQTWRFVIRFRKDIEVRVANTPLQAASKLVSPEGRVRLCKEA